MEYKSLFLGFLFAIGIFAVKSGAGSYYYLAKQGRTSKKAAFVIIFSLVYFLVFGLSAILIQQTDILKLFLLLQSFISWSMNIHFLIAAGLIVWGWFLLKSSGEKNKKSMGWLALIIPCPVCITVIFFTLAFLISFFPGAAVQATLIAYAGFIVIHTLTLFGLNLLVGKSVSAPELTLGGAMLIVAVYFLLSVFIMPQFADLDRIYRLAAYPGQDPVINHRHMLFVLFALGSFFSFGFLLNKMKKGRKPACK